MAEQSKSTLKTYFKTGLVPNQSNYEDLIDSVLVQSDKNEIDNRLEIVEEAQTSGAIGFDTKADMDADTTQPDGALALVTNDPTASNNAWYRWDDAGGTWVKRAEFYATTLDPLDTSEAVTGKAVGDYVRKDLVTSVNESNLFSISNITDGRTLNSLGQTNGQLGWGLAEVDAIDGVPITIDNINIDVNIVISSFEDDGTTFISLLDTVTSSELPVTVTPIGNNVGKVLFRIYTDNSVLSDYENCVVQYGTEIQKNLNKYDNNKVVGKDFGFEYPNILSKSQKIEIRDGELLNVDGEIATASGWKTAKINIKPNTQYTIENIKYGKIRIATYNVDDSSLVSYQGEFGFTDQPITVTSGAGYYFRILVGNPQSSLSDYNDIRIEEGSSITRYADVIGGDRSFPTITESAESSTSILLDTDRINNQLIDSNGEIVSSSGWVMAKVAVTAGRVYEIGGFSIDSGGHMAFYASNETTLVQYGSVYTNSDLPIRVKAPEGSSFLYVDLARPTNTLSDYENAYIKEVFVTEIEGKRVGGANSSSNQSTNLGDDVTFGTVNATSINISGTLPTGTLASPPSGLAVGDYWLDTTDSSNHPQLRQAQVTT